MSGQLIRVTFLSVFLFLSGAVGAGQGFLVEPGQQLPGQVLGSAAWSRDYGSYVWLAGDWRLGRELHAAGVRFTPMPERQMLRVHDFHFDPIRPRVALAEAPRRIDGAGLGLVQFRGPVARADLSALRDAGLRPIQYYPHHAYLVWGQPDQLQQIRNVESVRWSGDFSPEFRLHPGLAQFEGRIENLNVHFYNDGNVDAVLDQLTSLGAEVLDAWPAQPDRRVWDAKVAMHANDVIGLAMVAQVVSVNFMSPEPELEDESATQVLAGNLDANNVPEPGYADWLASIGVDGSGVIWAITDTGMYYDHVDFGNRIVGGFSYPGCTNVPHPGAEPNNGGGHGTHVGGISGGSGAAGYTDNLGLLYGLGMAPEMLFFAQNPICGSQSSWPPSGGWPVLSRNALEGGAIGTNNSWTSGEGTAHGYQNSERTHDFMVLDGNFETTEYEPFNIVFSAGNSGPGSSTLTAPKEAKNVVVTGGTQTHRVSGNVDAMYNSSSRGPAVDGRIKPTITAPAQQVSSAIKPNASSCTSTISGTNGQYSFCTGTSMAAPHASGAIVLLADWWRQNNAGADFSPAMGKALLMNTARRDVDGGTPIPNNNVGWGRIELTSLFDSDLMFEFWDQEILFEESGETWTTTVGVVDPTRPLRISLVWSDAPGAVGANPALVNDLDLEVETGGELYLGNVFSGGWSATGGTPDRLNNLEHVFVEEAGGSAEITVRAHQIAGSVLVNDQGSDQAQHFALVCQNCQREPDFILNVTPTAATACAPDDAEYLVEIDSIMGFDDPVSLWVEDLDPILDANLSDETVVPPGSSDLTVSNTGATGTATFEFQILAESSTGIKNRTLRLDVVEQEPDQIVLLAPADGSQDITTRPTFAWSAVDDVDVYRLQVATDTGFGDVVLDVEVDDGTSYQPESDLDLGTQYYWRVQAENFCGTGQWSDTFGFTTRLEPEASFSATEFFFEVQEDDLDSQVLEIANVGTGNLNWSMVTDSPESNSRQGRFDGYFDIDNWELVNDPAGVGGSFSTEDGPPVELFVIGGDAGTGGDTDFQIEIPMDGVIHFDWGYQSSDTGCWDSGGYAINGVYTELACNNTPVPYFNESESVEVSEGDLFAFRVHTQDGLFGEGVFGVTNFEFEPAVCGDELTNVPWLSVDPAGGVVAEGDAQNVSVLVNTFGMAMGEYIGYLCVTTNDPANELVPMPVELEVTERLFDPPVIEIDPVALSASVDEGDLDTGEFVISNHGEDDLNWVVDPSPAGCELPAWAGVDPSSGSVPEEDNQTVTVTFDASDLAAGTYHATVCIASNDPDNPQVGVELELEVLATTALIEGLVTSLGYCQADPSAQGGAQVLVAGQQDSYGTTTDGDGLYSISVPADESPVSITATYPNHRSDSVSDVVLEAGASYEFDFELVLREPCAAVDPASLSFLLVAGQSDNGLMAISNVDGGADLEWSLDTGEGCFDPADPGWLSLSHTQGTILWGNVREVTVSVDSDGLEDGSYTANLCIETSDENNASILVPIELDVVGPDIFHDRFEVGE